MELLLFGIAPTWWLRRSGHAIDAFDGQPFAVIEIVAVACMRPKMKWRRTFECSAMPLVSCRVPVARIESSHLKSGGDFAEKAPMTLTVRIECSIGAAAADDWTRHAS